MWYINECIKSSFSAGHENCYKKCDNLETYSVEQEVVGSFRPTTSIHKTPIFYLFTTVAGEELNLLSEGMASCPLTKLRL